MPTTSANVARLIALGALAILGAAIVWQMPQAIVDAGRAISETRGASDRERSLGPVRGQDLPTEVFTGVEQILPRDATFDIIVGDSLRLTENQRVAIEPLLRYWLLPRRRVDLEDADWVIAYGAPTETIPAQLEPGVEVSPGVVVAAVMR